MPRWIIARALSGVLAILTGVGLGMGLRSTLVRLHRAPLAQKIQISSRLISGMGMPVSGRAVAPVQVVEFGDYECPACRAAANTIKDAISHHPEAMLLFRHLPLPQHPHAHEAASLQAGAPATYQAYVHRRLMDGSPALDITTVKALEAIYDPKGHRSTVQTQRVLDADFRDAKRLEIRGIPALFVCAGTTSYRIRRPQDLDGFLDTIKAHDSEDPFR